MTASVREQFPVFSQLVEGQRLVYLDSAATSQKPQQVIKALADHYRLHNANVHRATHALGRQATRAYEAARDELARFLNVPSREQLIISRGATESLNLIALGYLAPRLGAGDEIVVTALEHHANLLPWQQLARRHGALLRIAPLDAAGDIDRPAFRALLNERTRLVAMAHVSNVLGTVLPVAELVQEAHAVGAITVVDGCQAAAHLAIDVQALNCDFYVISGHKMYGPTGVGALYGRLELLEGIEPVIHGGEMVAEADYHSLRYAELPYRLEPGTPPIAEAVAMGAAAMFMQSLDWQRQREREADLLDELRTTLAGIAGVQLVGSPVNQVALQSFTVAGWHPHDLARALDLRGIAVRAGHHCAQPLIRSLGLAGTVRASLGVYNGPDCIAALAQALQELLSDNARDHRQQGQVHLPAGSWPDRYQALLKLGREQPRWLAAEQAAAIAVSGCESRTWLRSWQEEESLYLAGDSDSALIRGVLALLLSQVNGQPAEVIKNFDFDEFLEGEGLWRELSPSRGNGLRAIIHAIRQLAAERERVF